MGETYQNFVAAVAFALVATAMAIAGTLDYMDQQREAETYRQMVCSGAWPDFKGLEPDCADGGAE